MKGRGSPSLCPSLFLYLLFQIVKLAFPYDSMMGFTTEYFNMDVVTKSASSICDLMSLIFWCEDEENNTDTLFHSLRAPK